MRLVVLDELREYGLEGDGEVKLEVGEETQGLGRAGGLIGKGLGEDL